MIEQICIPYVGAIIERTNDYGEIEVLVQTRWSLKYNSIYNGTIEFAAGTLDIPYENVYDAIRREVEEETGYIVSKFIDSNNTDIFSPQRTDKAFGFKPFCCTQQLLEGRPWVGFIFRVEVEAGIPRDQKGETKDVRWTRLSDILEIFKTDQERLFTLEVPAWEYYFKEHGMLEE
ncbi:MAG: hypothetical protein QG593_198 [Patescibacteria group bacterium]|jgi:8-oxo-dGTP pyrophosphatase MutT (NUDIX family)|nr:hypothetical protein [Patescibacteria group bacterium]